MRARYQDDPELGCAHWIFLAIDVMAAIVCLWAVLAGGHPVLTFVGVVGLFGVIVSAGAVIAGPGPKI